MRSKNNSVSLCLCGFLSAVIGLCALIAIPVNARAQEKQPQWDPNGIEDFELTECHGKTVTKADLLGKPWLAAFVFTRCAGPCPRVSAQMEILQKKTADLDVRLVSFTVDPDNDTPEVLQKYAERYHADPDRWWFLTGNKRMIYGLIQRSFRMPVQETFGKDRIPGFEIIHSVNIMHVDAEGRVVGKYNAADDVDMARLRRKLLGKADPEDADILAGAPDDPDVPDWVKRLPAVNASLNALATVLLLTGLALIKATKPDAHKAVMLSAFVTSIAFLGCYLAYHVALRHFTGSHGKSFAGTGPIRTVYFAILISHIILAITVPVLAILTIYRGLKSQWDKHKRIAKITFPIWLYVSITGVIIYGMLYHWAE